VGKDADAQEQIKQLRATPVDGVIAEAVFALLTAAQVKLGRRDARLLIDLSTIMINHARDYLPGDLTKEIDRLLGGLRLGQVTAENEAARKAEAEANDLDRIPSPPHTPVAGAR
jgi:hypothetical protein